MSISCFCSLPKAISASSDASFGKCSQKGTLGRVEKLSPMVSPKDDHSDLKGAAPKDSVSI